MILPDVLFANNPNVDADDDAGGLANLPLNRRHPLHVLVHLGVPGADGSAPRAGTVRSGSPSGLDAIKGGALVQ